MSGDIEKLKIQAIDKATSIAFTPAFEGSKNYQLPVIKALKNNSSIEVFMEPVGAALDCRSLLQFTELKSLSLFGNIYHLYV